jgi:hypothetical protein
MTPTWLPSHALRRPAAALGFALLFFVCVQLALNVALERGYPELRDPEYAAKLGKLRARLAEAPGRPLVLLFGSSRCLLGLRPAAIPPCRAPDGREAVVFNAGLLGAGPLLELICLRRLLADGVRPDWVVLECWPAAEPVEDLRIPARRLSWADLRLLTRYTCDPVRLDGEWAEARLLPCYAYRQALVKCCVPRWLPAEAFRGDDLYPPDRDGWAACPIGTDPRSRPRLTARACTTFAEVLRNFRHTETADRALREFLTVCRQHRIRAALLVMPEGSGIRGSYPAAVRAAAEEYLARLARDFDVPLLDACDWATDADFADGYHLLPAGADAFSARFGREAVRPLLEGRLAPPPEVVRR